MREANPQTGQHQAGEATSIASLSAARSQALVALHIALRWGDERASAALARIAVHQHMAMPGTSGI